MKINNWCKQLSATLAAAGLASAGSLLHANTTTTLTGLGTTNDPVPANHGSNAEVNVTWDATWDQYADWNGRGDVYQIDERVGTIMFAPALPTIKVTIDSFDLDEWAGGGDTSVEWAVNGATSGVLASGTWTDKNAANDPTDAGGRTLISPNAMGLPGETLTVVFDHTASGGAISYLAMDNLTFSSTVIPEPSTAVMAWLGVGGLGALAMRRQRK
jgi:MYXO-CTERM domain-containing protein